MSTKSTLFLISNGEMELHLYRDISDGTTYLRVDDADSAIVLRVPLTTKTDEWIVSSGRMNFRLTEYANGKK